MCKRSYAEVSSKRASFDALTADPPPVVSSGPIPRYSAPLPELGRFPAPPAPAPPLSDPTPRTSPSPSFVKPTTPDRPPSLHGAYDPDSGLFASADEHEEVAADPTPEAPPQRPSTDDVGDEVEEAPLTLRSSRVEARSVPAPREVRPVSLVERFLNVAPPVGIGAGVLSAVVSLAGDGGTALRLPLSLFAAAMSVVYSVLAPRDRGETSRVVLIAPVIAAAIVTCHAFLAHPGEVPNGSYAVYTGLASAALLAAALLVQRARRELVAAWARVNAGLASTVRVASRTDGSKDGDAEEISADQVKPGEEILVFAGETIGVDGIVTHGSGEVAPWLDAKIVVTKREGDAVVAGASLVSGQLRVTATFTGNERAWLRFARASSTRSALPPLVVFARRIAEPSIPVAALVVAAAAYANNASWGDVALSACAGAYALAATMAITAIGIAHARGLVATLQRGIVYKDAVAFDAAARADVAVVCSRGTVLLGEPEIVAAEAVSGKNTDGVLALAAGAEMAASDAVANAILREARARSVKPENVRSALVHAGLGVTALVPSGDKVVVGSRAFLLEEKVSVALLDGRVNELEAQGRSVLLVAVAGRLVGLLALQDGLRPGARAAIQRVHNAHIEPVLLSGEARDTCETIARALDIEHVRPEVLPSDRGAEVRALADGGHVVAAIGHASSDDDALGAADVSVAMGAAGLSPGEWGVALASDDVRDAALALTVPRACRDRSKTAALACAGAQAFSSIGIAFGVAPPATAPVVGLLAAFVGLALVRDPTTTR